MLMSVGRAFAMPFNVWMIPASATLIRTSPGLFGFMLQPAARGAFWGAVGWFGLDYMKPNLANIYNGESPGVWKIAKWDDPDATWFPPWLIAGWMAMVAFKFMGP